MLIYRVPGSLDDSLDLLWEAGATGLEERGGFVRAYFEKRAELPADLGGEWLEEEDQDWQAAFKRDLKAVVAGRITIAPPWLAHEVADGQLPLIIEPGMAFGTGHHATTRMATEALSDLDLRGQTVLDVGTGSGVLAMAAARLGARLAYGIDLDPLTIPVARENAEQNGLYPPQLRFSEGTLSLSGAELCRPEGEDLAGYGVVVANLYAELHALLAPSYRAHLLPGGHLILTGILAGRLDLVTEALKVGQVSDLQVRLSEDGEWALVTGRAL
ncbi:50S ribosomal protein L11 methyltransferase [Deinococcus lacus]|uniref:Ribosomal protein L11 methyltransferase n=1 Tax=Deinococcus lacus TaxID=392561 RepID=A0ABW1YCF8_9DEIO